MQPSAIPPGWYDDGLGSVRWWDGGAWTDQTYRGQLAVGVAPAATGAASGAPLSYATAVLPGTSTVTAQVAYHPMGTMSLPPSGDGVLPLVLGIVVLVAAGFTLVTFGGLSILGLLVGVGLLVRARAEFRGVEPPYGLARNVLPRGSTRLTVVVLGLLLITCGIPAMSALAGPVTPRSAAVAQPPPVEPRTPAVTWPAGYTEAPPDGAYQILKDDGSRCPAGSRCSAVSVVMSRPCAHALVRVEYFADTTSGVAVDSTIYQLTGVKRLKATWLLVSTTRDLDYFRVTSIGCS